VVAVSIAVEYIADSVHPVVATRHMPQALMLRRRHTAVVYDAYAKHSIVAHAFASTVVQRS
jgi:hypothetical protein